MKEASWVDVNRRWIYPLMASVILIMSPLLMSTFLSANELPGWLVVIATLFGCLGSFWAGLNVRLTTSRSAQVICLVVSIACWILAGWQIAGGLKH
ncbi:hypothetical protein G3O06_23490 [Burkholderia sp. Ac-20345]|uniref:hypothetical protein n=1 Tax=Burkholderia sp. Ac-20345 TaxID=2703891 RepID=UPI00197BA5D2|nr:hypothetical protein [Burkholderia sp. Ac-20345]MBN3780481.1 hypothetical protein [Burkholderia sp. Ac-20345]